MTTGEVMRTARREMRLSQHAMAERMRNAGFTAWHQTTVSGTETGQRRILLDEAVALATITGLSLDALAGLSQPDQEVDVELRKARRLIATMRALLSLTDY